MSVRLEEAEEFELPEREGDLHKRATSAPGPSTRAEDEDSEHAHLLGRDEDGEVKRGSQDSDDDGVGYVRGEIDGDIIGKGTKVEGLIARVSPSQES